VRAAHRHRARGRGGSSLLGIAVSIAILLVTTSAAYACNAHLRAGFGWPAWQRPSLLPLSIGGGPQRGVRAATDTASTPTDYGDCGRDALPETGLQGQVPITDQVSGRSKKGYRCNLRLIGQTDISTRGANFQLGWYKNCAYVGIVGNQFSQPAPGLPAHPLDGVAVIDASKPSDPQVVGILQSPMGRTQHEGVEVNHRRGMLVVYIGGLSAQWIEIYDVTKDCRKPVFKGRYDAGEPAFHGLRISRDGKTVYASDNFGTSGEMLYVIDVSNLAHPKLITAWNPQDETPPEIYTIHDLDLSADGTRAYIGASPPSAAQGALFGGGPSSNEEPTTVILDTTDIKKRRRNPDLNVISALELPNFGHTVLRARIGGRPYLFSSGESPFSGPTYCPWAWGHVIDINNERKPKPVSEIKLEVNEQSNCSTTGADDANYSIHYIGVDDPRNAKKLFYTYYTGGLRIFDVRNPRRPKEIAYYHPPPKDSTLFPSGPTTGDRHTPTWDSVTSDVRYRADSGHIWFVSIAGGFQILKLTGRHHARTDVGADTTLPAAGELPVQDTVDSVQDTVDSGEDTADSVGETVESVGGKVGGLR
jgi:hypothetical protein